MNERRRHPRSAFQTDAKLRVLSNDTASNVSTINADARLVNISCSGFCVVSKQVLHVSDVVEMQFSLPEKPAPIKVYAEMVWHEHSGGNAQRMGMRFLAIRDSDMQLIVGMQRALQQSPFNGSPLVVAQG